MIHKKKLKLIHNYNNENINIIHPFDRQNNYLNLVRSSLRQPDTVDINMSDEEGLRRAYATDKGIYTFGDRMYIAGTKSLNDAKDDVLHIPFWGSRRNIQRYQDARDALLDHPEVKHTTGHSLGGSVASQLQR